MRWTSLASRSPSSPASALIVSGEPVFIWSCAADGRSPSTFDTSAFIDAGHSNGIAWIAFKAERRVSSICEGMVGGLSPSRDRVEC